MTRKPVDGLVVSIRQRLLNTATRTGDDANQVWSRYAVERLLYRLSISEFSREFVLKGASLFAVWTGEPYRPTLDLDLLAYGEDSEERSQRSTLCKGLWHVVSCLCLGFGKPQGRHRGG